jgi:DNA-binding transcriptional LysR family regulator
MYEARRRLDIDDWLAARAVQRHLVATVPSLSAVAAFVQGGPWLATLPSLLHRHALRGLAHVDVPLPTPALPMYMAWHRRHHADPVQQWVRGQLEAVVTEAGL